MILQSFWNVLRHRVLLLLMNRLPDIIKDMIIFVLASALIGIGAQSVLPNGIGVKTNITMIESESSQTAVPTVSIDPSGNGDAASMIELNDAFVAHENGEALFLDARSQEDFLLGHIMGAVNIPVHAFMDSLAFLEQLDQDKLLITYCDGADCNASIELASSLKMMGFARVSFFFGGWQEWLSANYPTQGSSD